MLSETLTYTLEKIYQNRVVWAISLADEQSKSLEKYSSSHISCKIVSGNMWPPTFPICGIWRRSFPLDMGPYQLTLYGRLLPCVNSLKCAHLAQKSSLIQDIFLMCA